LWLGWLVYLEIEAPGSGLGADPREGMGHYLGEWAIRGLLLAVSVTPLRRILRQPWLARCRRLVGLYAFTYVFLHLVAYVVLYVELDIGLLVEDFVERSYITAGIAAFVCLLLMAMTSTRGWQRRLRQNWRRLHRLVFLAVVLAIVHLVWLTKDDFLDAVLYSVWFAVLIAERSIRFVRR
jgi:sulfoxide reductase heme-binding subunit YedZ